MSHAIVPRVFVSAVSSDLRAARKVVNEALTRIGCLPIEESILGTEYGKIRAMIEKRMADCNAVVHLVGRDYGGEPDRATLPEGQARRSWTQMEYDYAIEHDMKLYIIVCTDNYPYETRTKEPGEKQALQMAHRELVLGGTHLWHEVADEEALQRCVEQLREPAEAWRVEIEREQAKRRRLTQRMIGVGVAILLALAGLGRKVGNLGNAVEDIPDRTAAEVLERIADPQELSARLRKHIETRFEADRDDARARGAKWEAIRELEKRRDAVLAQVDDLIRTIQHGLAGEPDPVFSEASRILVDEGPEAAIAYLESHRTDILSRVDQLAMREESVREEKHKALEPLLLEAELHRTNLRWEESVTLYQTVAEKAPEWSRARRELGSLLYTLARYDEAESELLTAHALAVGDEEVAAASNELGQFYMHRADWQRAEPLLKGCLELWGRLHGEESVQAAEALNNLAQLLKATNRLSEAEPLMRRALFIDESSYGPANPGVARDLNNLAQLLKVTNRLSDLEPLMRRALSIDDFYYGPDYPDVAVRLNNLAQLLQATNRLSEAEPLMRRALAIDESSYGPDHPDVSRDLNNLAELLRSTNRVSEAELLMRRALAVGESSYGPAHPTVAIRLNNLAELLRSTNRLAEAEPLIRRALSIDEAAYEPDHPKVAVRLNNLAQLLQATNRLSEAEPVMRRAHSIDEFSYAPDHPIVANRLNNLAGLLQATKRLSMAEPLYRRALSIDEASYGPGHLFVARDLNNLASLLHSTDRLSEAVPLMQRQVAIYCHFGLSAGHEDPRVELALKNYVGLLAAIGLPRKEIRRRVDEAVTPTGPFAPITPEVDRLLGPATPVTDVFVALDHEYKEKNLPAIWFLPLNESAAPHLDSLLGPAESTESVLEAMDATYREQGKPNIWFLPLDQPISPHLNKFLNTAASTEDVLKKLDASYREQNKPPIWFLPLDEPISPHLDELLGPLEPTEESKPE